MSTTTDLAAQYDFHPRLIVLSGKLEERTKKSTPPGGLETPISGFTPHYARQGVPTVDFTQDGEPNAAFSDAACIEANLAEDQDPMLRGVLPSYGRPLNLLHLIFGQTGRAPNREEFLVLREAGQIMAANRGQHVQVVCLPILSAGQYGVAQGRLYVMGLFDGAGQALWVHPNALSAGAMKGVKFPEGQKFRSTEPGQISKLPAKVIAPPTLDWYATIDNTLRQVSNLRGAALQSKVLNVRAGQVAKQLGISEDQALAQVTAEFKNHKAQEAANAASGAKPPVSIPTEANSRGKQAVPAQSTPVPQPNQTPSQSKRLLKARV